MADYTSRIEPTLRPLLRDAEKLLVASPLVSDPGTTETVSVSDELKNLLDPTLLVGLGAHPGELLRQATFGRALLGGPGSVAHSLYEAVDNEQAPALALTDRRLLVYRTELVDQPGRSRWQRWFGPVEQRTRLVHEVGREQVVGAVAAPAGVLRRGRFLLIFTDRSACALVASVSDAATRAVSEIGPPQTHIGAEGEGPA
ncbi:hypothetical protein GA0074692_5502 [Micromonospora pallida]|uniref:Uncharacterized protein n=1 Tax=Micromonospora pallida TaxID=145854 RepID=A0A1C6TDR6_9ACTN|nr:hypothetical protein [Micromonospora pallida]SCL39839.1 hypothetical protein GA0074692_5502 [Micromonospora pallida]